MSYDQVNESDEDYTVPCMRKKERMMPNKPKKTEKHYITTDIIHAHKKKKKKKQPLIKIET